MLNGTLGSWLLSAVGNYRSEWRHTLTDRIGSDGLPFRPETRTRSTYASGLLLATGPVANLPAGPLQLTLGAGVDRETIGSHRSGRMADTPATGLTTTTLSSGLALPLASRMQGRWCFRAGAGVSCELASP